MRAPHRLLTVIIIMTLCLIGKAQDHLDDLRSVTSSYSVESGEAHIADTYLTPLHYRGSHSAFQYERDQAMKFNPQNWISQLKVGIAVDLTKNLAKNATMASLALEGSWAMMHRWQMPHNITLGIGPATTLNTGVLYLSRNSNNPASAKASWTLDLTGYALWTGTLWRLPLTVRYQPTLSLTGVFFSPDYGELYYQIYLGKQDGLVHAAWPGNFFNLDNLVTADLHFGNTSLRLGYHNRTFSSKVNDLVTQNITHAVVIGITTEWISLRPSDKSIKANIISSY